MQEHAVDPRWSNIILCLLHELQRPNEVDRLLVMIREAQGDLVALTSRDLLLAEATFGEFKTSPRLVSELADSAFQQIEVGRLPAVRRALAVQAVEGLSSPIAGPRVLQKLFEWFPRWHSYGLAQVFHVIGDWPEDSEIEPILWRGLHDEFYGTAQEAAMSFAKRFGGDHERGERLCRLISAPASFSAAAAAIEALWNGWPELPRLNDILTAASRSTSPIIAIAAVRGRISLGKHGDDDFALLTELGERDDYRINGLIGRALLEGWTRDERLRTYALKETAGERRRRMHRVRPDFGLLINGFPGDFQVAEFIARDFSQEHPHCLFEMENFAALGTHFKGNPIIVAALRSWVVKQRAEDDYTIAYAARVAPTDKFKAALLKCLESEHSYAFWGASALVDLWGPDDKEVRSALLKWSELPVKRRQNVAHILPLVMTDKKRCRELLLEVVTAGEQTRADFALQGLRLLGVDASDHEATNCVLGRGYDEERFVLENEVREVILTFKTDERVIALARRQMRRESGMVSTVAQVYADSAEMRRLVLSASAPLDVNLRSILLSELSVRATYDPHSRSLISDARLEGDADIIVGASIAFAQVNKQDDTVSPEYINELKRELDAIGPRMDARRQGALAGMTIIGRPDLLKKPDGELTFDRVGTQKYPEMLRFTAMDWATFTDGFGGDEATLAALGLNRRDFFDVFGNYMDASTAIKSFSLRIINDDAMNGVPATAIKLVERAYPGTGYLRDICLKSLTYRGRSNWD